MKPPTLAPKIWLISLLALTSIELRAQGSDEVPDIVYVLAGQSNIYRLANSAPGCGTGSVQSNVFYYAAISSNGTRRLSAGFPDPGAQPIMELGTKLGQLHAPAHVHIVMNAVDQSALLKRNNLGTGYWIDPAFPSDPAALMNQCSRLMTQLGFADELHIIWGQGETDAIAQTSSNPITTSDQYSYWAQIVFAGLAAPAGHTNTYKVHLVTIGSINSPLQGYESANAIRDAYMNMDRSTMAIGSYTPPIDTVAHHYDLQHASNDPHHLTPCGYVTLGARIANGIMFQAQQPRLSSLAPTALTIAGNDLTMLTNTDLVTLPIGNTATNYFHVWVNNQRVANFMVGASGKTLTIRCPSPPVPPITVRYVAGSGHNLGWAPPPPSQAPLRSIVGQAPLEPFVITR